MNRRDWLRRMANLRRFVFRKVLHADDPPHSLALGVALGVFVALTPTVGFQMVLVVALASLFRVNRAIGIPLVWISNPATFVPIYYPSYRIGVYLLGGKPISQRWWQEIREPPEGMIDAITFYWKNLTEIIGALTLGCIVVATPIATACYLIVYRLIVFYRARRFKKLRKAVASSQSIRSPKTEH